METIVITDAQNGVTCPSCGVKDSNSWEWIGSEWTFACRACGAEHEVVDRQASVTIWLAKEAKAGPGMAACGHPKDSERCEGCGFRAHSMEREDA